MKNKDEIINDVLDVWLNMLDNGIGGLPTPEETKWFNRLSDALPKELRDARLDKLSDELK